MTTTRRAAYAAVQESVPGTFRTWPIYLVMSVPGGKADIGQ
jgi:hypothetical protein